MFLLFRSTQKKTKDCLLKLSSFYKQRIQEYNQFNRQIKRDMLAINKASTLEDKAKLYQDYVMHSQEFTKKTMTAYFEMAPYVFKDMPILNNKSPEQNIKNQ